MISLAFQTTLVQIGFYVFSISKIFLVLLTASVLFNALSIYFLDNILEKNLSRNWKLGVFFILYNVLLAVILS